MEGVKEFRSVLKRMVRRAQDAMKPLGKCQRLPGAYMLGRKTYMIPCKKVAVKATFAAT